MNDSFIYFSHTSWAVEWNILLVDQLYLVFVTISTNTVALVLVLCLRYKSSQSLDVQKSYWSHFLLIMAIWYKETLERIEMGHIRIKVQRVIPLSALGQFVIFSQRNEVTIQLKPCPHEQVVLCVCVCDCTYNVVHVTSSQGWAEVGGATDRSLCSLGLLTLVKPRVHE